MKVVKKSARENITYAKDYIGFKLYILLQFLLCILPQRLAYLLADLLGSIMFIFAKRNRALIEGNLRIGLGLDKALVEKYSRRIFKSFCRNTVDFLRFHKFNGDWFKNKVEIVGIKNLKDALSQGRGVVIISAHLGNYEIGALILAMAGIPVNGIWASHRNPKVEDFFIRQRIEKGIKVILTGGSMSKILEALAANELVAFVIDHSYSKRGIGLKFFGHKSIIPIGAAYAALKSKAPIIPIITVRGGDLRYKLICGDIIKYNLNRDDSKNTETILLECLKPLEEFIRQYPDQWVLFRKCWDEGDKAIFG